MVRGPCNILPLPTESILAAATSHVYDDGTELWEAIDAPQSWTRMRIMWVYNNHCARLDLTLVLAPCTPNVQSSRCK
jgi:hypothetical protein